MRRFSPKFRIRSLQVVIALIALAVGGWMTWQRWTTNSALARFHAGYEAGSLWTGRQCLDNVVEYEQMRRQFLARGDLKNSQNCVENSAPFAEEARKQFRQAEYHAQLKRYYESRW
jgi:hypothetical protein